MPKRSDDYRKMVVLKAEFNGEAVWGELVSVDGDSNILIYARGQYYEVEPANILDEMIVDCEPEV